MGCLSESISEINVSNVKLMKITKMIKNITILKTPVTPFLSINILNVWKRNALRIDSTKTNTSGKIMSMLVS